MEGRDYVNNVVVVVEVYGGWRIWVAVSDRYDGVDI